eukprot:1542726-Amphidinium_carterae.1
MSTTLLRYGRCLARQLLHVRRLAQRTLIVLALIGRRAQEIVRVSLKTTRQLKLLAIGMHPQVGSSTAACFHTALKAYQADT